MNTAVAFISLGAGLVLASFRQASALGGRAQGHLEIASLEVRVVVGFVGALLLLAVSGGWTYRSTAQ